jgi:hypothetical protein
MSIQAVLLPVFVLVALTFILLGLMGRSRLRALKGRELHLRDIALGQNAWPPKPARYGRAYENQFELPMLFYVLVVLAHLTHKADLLFVILAWVFVLARLAHAYIHVTTNHVPRRFAAFLMGMGVLVLMWLIFAIRVLAAL